MSLVSCYGEKGCTRRISASGVDNENLGTLAPNQRGRKPNPNKKETQELVKLKRDNARLTERLRQAELIIEVQKKVSEMMGIKLPEKDD